jgi:acetoacetate decarboxylase
MFRFAPDTSYLMPAHFGGSPLSSWTYADVTTVGISYRTDGDALARYVPECFEITQPVVEIGDAMNRGVEWMAAGGYNLVAVNVPVLYRNESDNIAGSFAMAVWESKATPILGGREQTSIPKIFADVADLRQFDNHPTLYPIDYKYTAAWRAAGTVDWQLLTWEQNPTQARIIEALGALPVEPYVSCVVTSGSQVIRVDAARELAW